MPEQEITRLKDLCMETRLTGDGTAMACLVIPSRKPYPRLARAIQRTIQAYSGVALPIRYDTEVSLEAARQTNIIALGNLSDNRLIETLYYRWYTIVDRSYPGPGGYVLQTVHDPWGAGCNVVILGASDPEGIERAVQDFQQRLPSERAITLPRRHHVVFGHTLQPAQERLLRLVDEPLEGDWGFGLRGELIGLYGLYHILSGMDVFAERCREGLLLMASLSPERIPEVQVHLRFFSKMILWDIIEESPVFTDQDRLTITNYLLRVLRSEEGFANSRFQETLAMDAPRQNHQTILAMGLLFGGQYFEKYYHLAEAVEWLRATDRLFANFARYAKPACDCSDHGWRMTIPTAMLYAMASGNMACFAGGAIRDAAERAIICCNNLGRMPALGDCDHAFYPTSLFAQAAHYYRDGRYLYLLQKRASLTGTPSHGFRLPSGDFDEFERPFDSGVQPVEPADMTGIRVARLDAQYYAMPEQYPAYARRLYGIPMPVANIPLNRAFDKISLRAGFAVEDQYMLIDGAGGGNHSYEDANAIVEFSQYGRAFLVTEDSLHWPNFRDHNVVTVTRDGAGATSPSFASLDQVFDSAQVGLLCTSLRDHNRMDWFRHLIWVKGAYFVILDELVALDPGEYACQCHWKMIGQPHLSGDTFTVIQEDARAFLKNADHLGSWLEEVDISRSTDHQDERLRLRMAQYRLDRLTAHALHQRAVAQMEAGERMMFHNLLYASAAAKPSVYRIRRLDAGLVEITGDGAPAYMGAGAQHGALQTDARLFYVADRAFALAGGTYLRCPRALFASEAPVSIAYDLAAGSGFIETTRPTTVTLPAGGPVGATIDGQEARVERAEAEDGFWRLTVSVPAGRHRIAAVPPGDRVIAVDAPQSEARPAPPVDSSRRSTNADAPAPRWRFNASAPLTACHIQDIDADGQCEIATGFQDGAIRILNPDGSDRWACQTGGAVNSLYAADLDGDGIAELIAGSDDGHVYAIDRHGREMWRHAPEFGYQHWPWWTQGVSKVKRVYADDLDNDGYPEIIAGVANMRLHVLDRLGIERWNLRTDHGLFVTFSTADLNGDGFREIIGGLAIKGSNSNCLVIDRRGQVVNTLTNHGWTSQLTALVVDDLDDDGRLEVACGINRGDNLRVFDGESAALAWSRHLGDPVTALIAYPSSAGKRLIAGSPSGYVCAFDGKGKRVWMCDLGSPVSRFALGGITGPQETTLLAGCDDGLVWMLDDRGRKRRCLPALDGRITVLWSGMLQPAAGPVVVAGSPVAGLSLWPWREAGDDP